MGAPRRANRQSVRVTGGLSDVGELSRALLAAGIEAAFPQSDFARLAVIDRGFGSIVVGLPEEVIVRVPRTEVVAAAHVHEGRLLSLLRARVPVAVPEVRWRASPAAGLPFGASAYQWMAGSQPVVPVAANGSLVNDLAAFIARLHTTPLSLIDGVQLPGPRELAQGRRDDGAAVEPELRKRLLPREFSRLQARLAGVLGDPLLDDFAPVLRHGDLWFGNLLIDESSGRLTAVLDWEHAAIGDPAEDIATQRYLGDGGYAAVADRYAQLVDDLDPQLLRRADHHFALREISGIRRCIEMHDDDELTAELEKLRTGPLLA